LNIELISYRSFGYQCPVAIIRIDSVRQIYTREGIQSLYNMEPSNNKLELILASLIELKNRQIDEIKWDDLSGQEKLF